MKLPHDDPNIKPASAEDATFPHGWVDVVLVGGLACGVEKSPSIFFTLGYMVKLLINNANG